MRPHPRKDVNGDTHAFVLSNGEFTAFDYPGVRFTQFVDINSEGDIVGVYQSDGKYHTFVYEDGEFRTIDPQGTLSAGGPTSVAGINPRGDIVGQYATDASGVTHGFVLDANGFTTLDIPGYVSTVVTGINPRGDMVGRCRGADGKDIAFVIWR